MNLAQVAMDAYDLKNAASLSDEYLATQTNLFTKENLEFINKFTRSSKDKGFAMMLNNADKVNAVLGAGKAEEKVMGIIMQEDIYPIILKKDAKPDWQVLSEKLEKKYPAQATELSSKAKVIFYQAKGDWNNFASEIVGYMNKYGEKATSQELNSYAWAVFENCKDMTCVTQALDWSKRSFKDKDNEMFMDTYANILHKMGKTQDAIVWEKKALALATGDQKKSYQETLDKMEKGEKTWKD